MDTELIRTVERRNQHWREMANAKLCAESVDPTDIEAARETLCACVGGRRLFQIWAEVHAPMIQLELSL